MRKYLRSWLGSIINDMMKQVLGIFLQRLGSFL